jgi:CubicO group peptidase (beta-lactamase class C family)
MKYSRTGLVAILMTLSIGACGGSGTSGKQASIAVDEDVSNQLARLVEGDRDPTRELSGLAVAVLRDGDVVFERAYGRAFIDPTGEHDRELTPDSLMRVASISKTLSAIVVMQLVQEGTLDLDRDVSDYLGWELRNPNYPDRAITLRYLLAHVSSIRDAGESYIIRYPRALQEAFDPSGPDFGERFQIAEEGWDRGPGVFFEYCNLNYGIVGTVLEKVTGRRFDVLMRERFFEPLGLTGGFNVAGLPPADRQNIATLYRKRDQEEIWHPEGEWVAQVDDLSSGIPTALPDDADYVPGTNGAQFSPQGGARLSLKGLETLATIFLGDGSVGDVRLLSPESMAEMRRPVWRYDPEKRNLDDYNGTLNAWATGIRIITGETAGDRLFAGDHREWYGHFGEAYGFLGGVWADPETGDAVIYAITGSAFDPSADDGPTSTLAPIEAKVLAQLARLL